MVQAVTRCELLWEVPGLGPSSAAALSGEGLASLVVDAYLALPRVTCCSFQIGFWVDVDGVPWSDDGTVDEPWMTWSWIRALRQLLEGAPSAHAVPWEESSLTFRRDGDRVTMEDVHGSGRVSMREIEVSLRALATAMHRELAAMAPAIRAVRDEAARRTARDEAERDKLATISKELPDEGEHGLAAIDALGALLR